MLHLQQDTVTGAWHGPGKLPVTRNKHEQQLLTFDSRGLSYLTWGSFYHPFRIPLQCKPGAAIELHPRSQITAFKVFLPSHLEKRSQVSSSLTILLPSTPGTFISKHLTGTATNTAHQAGGMFHVSTNTVLALVSQPQQTWNKVSFLLSWKTKSFPRPLTTSSTQEVVDSIKSLK